MFQIFIYQYIWPSKCFWKTTKYLVTHYIYAERSPNLGSLNTSCWILDTKKLTHFHNTLKQVRAESQLNREQQSAGNSHIVLKSRRKETHRPSLVSPFIPALWAVSSLQCQWLWLWENVVGTVWTGTLEGSPHRMISTRDGYTELIMLCGFSLTLRQESLVCLDSLTQDIWARGKAGSRQPSASCWHQQFPFRVASSTFVPFAASRAPQRHLLCKVFRAPSSVVTLGSYLTGCGHTSTKRPPALTVPHVCVSGAVPIQL